MVNKSLVQDDLLGRNVSWLPEDLELYENGQSGLLISLGFTVLRCFTFVMAVIVHRAFYKLMKRLPGRAVNQIIYPYMVGAPSLWKKIEVELLSTCDLTLFKKTGST